MKSGFVETETSGHAEDFDSAVLIKQDEVDSVNVKILVSIILLSHITRS